MSRSCFLRALAAVVLLTGCDSASPTGREPSPGEGSASIGDFIDDLTYDAEALLNTQPRDVARDVVDADTTREQGDTDELTCVATAYSQQNNFDEIAVLRPTSDVVWPGALVEGNQGLLDGIPEPARFERAPVKIRIDLPGIGAEGVRTVEAPDAGEVQIAIDEALEWWNANAYQDGYTNANSSSSKVTTSYSSTQASLDLGLNVAWATGDVQSRLSYETSESRRVIFASYKQAFYTASYVVESGQQPEDVFGPSVSLRDVEAAFSNSAPPAYVSSVTYGRIVLFRMETSSSYQAADVEAAFRYAAGATVDGDVAATYESILRESSVEVVTLGGGAVDGQPTAFTALSPGDLVPVIDRATYSRSNPGVPIAYTVKYLKDDRLAKLGYTTDYTARECSSVRTRDSILITLMQYDVVRDCDAGPGDFEFDIDVLNNGTRIAEVDEGSQTSPIRIEAPDTRNVKNNANGFAIPSFTASRTAGATFGVKFTAKEWDDPPFGPPNTNDLNRSGTDTFTFDPVRASGWTNLGDGVTPRRITVEKANSCKVALEYTVEIK